jgi:transcriptional regulator with XRE-family HTH domain
MRNDFDTEALYAALDSHREAKKLTWKDVAALTGISASTLTRMAQGKCPDAKGLAALFVWSGFTADEFMRGKPAGKHAGPETLAKITALLRADRSLSKDSAAAIEEILKAAYNRFKEP